MGIYIVFLYKKIKNSYLLFLFTALPSTRRIIEYFFLIYEIIDAIMRSVIIFEWVEGTQMYFRYIVWTIDFYWKKSLFSIDCILKDCTFHNSLFVNEWNESYKYTRSAQFEQLEDAGSILNVIERLVQRNVFCPPYCSLSQIKRSWMVRSKKFWNIHDLWHLNFYFHIPPNKQIIYLHQQTKVYSRSEFCICSSVISKETPTALTKLLKKNNSSTNILTLWITLLRPYYFFHFNELFSTQLLWIEFCKVLRARYRKKCLKIIS